CWSFEFHLHKCGLIFSVRSLSLRWTDCPLYGAVDYLIDDTWFRDPRKRGSLREERGDAVRCSPQRLGAQFQFALRGLGLAQAKFHEGARGVERAMSPVRLLRRFSNDEGDLIFAEMVQSPFHIEPQPALQLSHR